MFRATRALTWELVAPQRWPLFGLAAYLLASALFVPLAPGRVEPPGLAQALAVPVCIPRPSLLAAFTHGGRMRLEQRISGFPPRLFALPVPAALLALPPLALGTLPALIYLFVAALVLRPG